MSREVIWTRRKYELMCIEGMLSDEDCEILRLHILRKSNQEIATILGYPNIDPINDAIYRLKIVYDELQKQFPDILDKRSKDIYKRKKP